MNDILQFPSHRPSGWREFDLSELVHETCESFAEESDRLGVCLDVDAPPNMIVKADREQLATALWSLLSDAVYSTPAKGDVIVTTFQDDDYFEIEVADSIEGVFHDGKPELLSMRGTPSKQSYAFNVIQRIANAHGGECTVCECPDGGRAVTLRIPQGGEAMQRREAA